MSMITDFSTGKGYGATSATSPTANGSSNGGVLDLNSISFSGGVGFISSVGGISGGGSVAIKLQESDSPTTGFTDVGESDIVGDTTLTLSSTNTAGVQTYNGSKRYIRAVRTVSGGATGLILVHSYEYHSRTSA